MYVTTVESTTVNVRISAPRIPSTQPPLDISVTRGAPANVTLSSNISLIGTGRQDKGIFISSDGDITVQCFSFIGYERSSGAYLALPTNVLSKKYMIATFCEINSCMFAVVGTENDTSVTISIKLPPNETVQFEGTTYSNGDIITLTINRYEAVQISSSGSFTGTLIRATADIAVFVGADYTSVRGRSGDHLVEQLQPLDSWGMDYMLIPFPDRLSFDLVMVTAQFEQTTVMYNNSQYVIDEAGENIILKLMSDTPSRLSSDKRVLVMQLSTSVSSDFDDIYDNDYGDYSDPVYYDPCMLLVTPMEQWISRYFFVSPILLSQSKPVVLALAANSDCTPLFKLMAIDTQISLTWIEISGTNISVSYTTLEQEGPYTVKSVDNQSTCSPLGGYIYGPVQHSAWTMPIGQSLKGLPDKRDKFVFSSTEFPMSVRSTSISTSSDSLGVTFTKLASVERSSLQSLVTGVSPTRYSVCTCLCKVTRTLTDDSSTMGELQKNLTVEKRTLSSRRRKKQSAVDPRSVSKDMNDLWSVESEQ
ncbi:IgGFc-binding protein-like [Gigantopelta aegis]|uniref:IgGFc-binding protein-like n=1 Tax=Gigantopelta aegis TaxID=1735272 RepID=UPI001B88C481|nr:IgGFc-binding protein-like [Gigantopelta aegis]